MSRHIRLLPFLLLLLSLAIQPPLSAQKPDSAVARTDSSRVLYFTADLEKHGKILLRSIDTTLTGFQTYAPLYRYSPFFATLGNTGQFYRSITPFDHPLPSGFDYGIHSFDRYLISSDSIRYYRVLKTYSELFYVQGAKKEQNFDVAFSRNIYRSLNLGFDFHVMNTPGAYYRQKTNHVSFDVTSQYFTKNRRYGLLANYTLNRIKNYENGGIRYDSMFENNLESNRMIFPVNLQTAQNLIRETGFYMKHYFDLTRHRGEGKDSTTHTRKGFELGRFTYSFRYNRQTQTYTDNQPDSGFYPTPQISVIKTYDSVAIIRLENELIWSNPSFRADGKPRVMELEAGIRQSYSEVALHTRHRFIRQLIPFAAITFTPFTSVQLSGRGDYVLGDYNTNDVSLQVRLRSVLGNQERNAGIVTVTGDYRLSQPEWFYSHYFGNHYQWDTAWQKQSYVAAGFLYNLSFAEAGVNVARITNFTYLGSSSLPRQNTQEFGLMRIWLNASPDLWRFRIRAKLIYQTVQGTSVLRLPAFLCHIGIYYSQHLFKGAAYLEPGFTVYYHTPYFADQYNPSLRAFYLQDSREIGDRFYIDFFINLKIQRARFFFTYTHLNAGFTGRDYYTTPGYPMPDGAFKFGIAWRFHD